MIKEVFVDSAQSQVRVKEKFGEVVRKNHYQPSCDSVERLPQRLPFTLEDFVPRELIVSREVLNLREMGLSSISHAEQAKPRLQHTMDIEVSNNSVLTSRSYSLEGFWTEQARREAMQRGKNESERGLVDTSDIES